MIKNYSTVGNIVSPWFLTSLSDTFKFHKMEKCKIKTNLQFSSFYILKVCSYTHST